MTLKALKVRRPNSFYLLLVFVLSILCFTAFRILLLSLHQKDILHFGLERHWLVAQAFFMGFRFDTVITCYLLTVPMAIVGLLSIAGLLRPFVLKIAYCYVGLVFTLAFLLCAADIPFYEHFFRRLDDTLIAWKEHSSFGVNMLLQETHYYKFMLLFVAAGALYITVLRFICKAHLNSLQQRLQAQPQPGYRWRYSLSFVLFAGYLSMLLNYPNYSDQVIGDKVKPGGDIYIHGGCVTVGCLPMTDPIIKELYILCMNAKLAGQNYIPVHIYPTRFDRKGLNYLGKEYGTDTTKQRFWVNLKSEYDYFEQTKKLLPVMYSPDGKYVF